MPPRRASPAKSRSSSTSQSARKSASPSSSPRASARPSGVVAAPSKSPSLPPPDPAAVQRLIDEAIARAQRNRAAAAAAAGNGEASAAATSMTRTSQGQPSHPGVVRSALNFLFGSRNCTYSASTTAKVTDLTGAFLVTCITVYFTVAGYLFYRELAIGGAPS